MDKLKIHWSSAVGPVLYNYNRMPHIATGYAPETLHFGRNLPNGLRSRKSGKKLSDDRKLSSWIANVKRNRNTKRQILTFMTLSWLEFLTCIHQLVNFHPDGTALI